MKRLPISAWLFMLCMSVISLHPVPVFADDVAGAVEPPSKEAFEVEVAALEQVVAELDAKAKSHQALYQQSRDDDRELREMQRMLRSAFNEASEAYREAWDQVRQLLQKGAEQDAVSEALKQAQDAEAAYEPKREVYEKQSAALDGQVETIRAKQNESYQIYRAAQDESRMQGRILRSAQSALRSIGREGWYADYLTQKQQLEAEIAKAKRQAEQEAAREAALVRQAAEWDERWEKMGPKEREEALHQLASELELLRAKEKVFGEQVDAMSKDVRAISDRRSESTRRYSDSVRLASALARRVRELERQGGTDPESQKQLAQARAEFAVAEQEQKQLHPLSNEIQKQLVAASNEYSALRKEYQVLRDQVSALSKRHHKASRGKPVGKDAEQREKEKKVIRETWELMAGKDVQWGDNPFQGQSVRTIGNITNQGPNMRLYYDSADYHAMYSMVGNERALHVFDSEAKVLFDGPVNRLPDLKDASQEVFYLWEYMAGRVTYNGR